MARARNKIRNRMKTEKGSKSNSKATIIESSTVKLTNVDSKPIVEEKDDE